MQENIGHSMENDDIIEKRIKIYYKVEIYAIVHCARTTDLFSFHNSFRFPINVKIK